MKIKVLRGVCAVLTLIAASVASTVCFWYFYQPREPKCLKK